MHRGKQNRRGFQPTLDGSRAASQSRAACPVASGENDAATRGAAKTITQALHFS
jgi:hypothetical protein